MVQPVSNMICMSYCCLILTELMWSETIWTPHSCGALVWGKPPLHSTQQSRLSCSCKRRYLIAQYSCYKHNLEKESRKRVVRAFILGQTQQDRRRMRDMEWCLPTDELSQTVQLERIIFTLSFEIWAWKNIMFHSRQLSCNYKGSLSENGVNMAKVRDEKRKWKKKKKNSYWVMDQVHPEARCSSFQKLCELIRFSFIHT